MKSLHIAAFAGTFLISIGAWQLKEVLDLRTQVARIEQKLDDHIAAEKAMADTRSACGALARFPTSTSQPN